MIKKDINKINFGKFNSDEIKKFIEKKSSSKGAYTIWNNKRFKIWNANIIKEKELIILLRDFIIYKMKIGGSLKTLNILVDRYLKDEIKQIYPGEIIYSNNRMGAFVKTIDDGIISISEIQKESSKRMEILAYLRGHEMNNKLDIQKMFDFYNVNEVCALLNMITFNKDIEFNIDSIYNIYREIINR